MDGIREQMRFERAQDRYESGSDNVREDPEGPCVPNIDFFDFDMDAYDRREHLPFGGFR